MTNNDASQVIIASSHSQIKFAQLTEICGCYLGCIKNLSSNLHTLITKYILVIWKIKVDAVKIWNKRREMACMLLQGRIYIRKWSNDLHPRWEEIIHMSALQNLINAAIYTILVKCSFHINHILPLVHPCDTASNGPGYALLNCIQVFSSVFGFSGLALAICPQWPIVCLCSRFSCFSFISIPSWCSFISSSSWTAVPRSPDAGETFPFYIFITLFISYFYTLPTNINTTTRTHPPQTHRQSHSPSQPR